MFLSTRDPDTRARREGPVIRVSESSRELLRELKRRTGAPFDALLHSLLTRELARHGVEAPAQ